MHISPTPHLKDFAAGRTHHLLLAHLVEEDQEYRAWYCNNKAHNPNHVYILDNSAFEMYKRGLPMYDPNKLIDMGLKVGADYLVLPDYPSKRSELTIGAAETWAPQFIDAGFKTFFVPQSPIGELGALIGTYRWAAESNLIDYIGVSILGVPNGYGVEKDNKLQRFLARWKFLNTLKEEGIFFGLRKKKIHLLGMVDGPNEIELLSEFIPYISTWDSSAAVWAGLNGIVFDDSPTGLVNGKFEKEVDFNFRTADPVRIEIAHANIEYIDTLVRKHETTEMEVRRSDIPSRM